MAKNNRPQKGAEEPTFPPAINPLGVRSVYSNNLEITFSSLDVRFNFNEIIAEQGTITVERRASIVTPIPHFKAIVEALNTSLAQLEEKLREQKAAKV